MRNSEARKAAGTICVPAFRAWHVRTTLPLLGALLISGCGSGDMPPLGKVHGTVTVNGKPLADAIVCFQAEDGKGRVSFGKTDAEGHYDVVYLRDIHGAKVGKHRVAIRTSASPYPEEESLPPHYNSKTELEADVQPGENPLDFDLIFH